MSVSTNFLDPGSCLMLTSFALRSSPFASRESAIHLYACMRTAGPRYSSWFHQYDGQDVEQHAQRMHS